MSIAGWTDALFAVSGAAFAAILLLALGQVTTGKPAFWPPEHAGSWSHRLFRGLFRLGVYPLVLAGAATIYAQAGTLSLARVIADGALVLTGFAVAFHATAKMGWANAFGEAKGLVTDGVFSYSRHPVYVATWVGLAGLALLIADPMANVAIGLWAALYLVAPALEEPWLEAAYGDAYRAYKYRVRRFF